LIRLGGMILTGQTKVLKRQTCPSATLAISNPMWNTYLGSNWPPQCFRPYWQIKKRHFSWSSEL